KQGTFAHVRLSKQCRRYVFLIFYSSLTAPFNAVAKKNLLVYCRIGISIDRNFKVSPCTDRSGH
ncbi:MAG: hypothetical protein OEM01_07850, partial [Desulfobulbaceae bacterium]|nr:hypothetical protein [Desulfobulbaceae bacterium]